MFGAVMVYGLFTIGGTVVLSGLAGVVALATHSTGWLLGMEGIGKLGTTLLSASLSPWVFLSTCLAVGIVGLILWALPQGVKRLWKGRKQKGENNG